MGQQITYTRRKQERECFNGENVEKKLFQHTCACTDVDYECDEDFMRMDDGSCVRMKKKGKQMTEAEAAAAYKQEQCEDSGFYSIT